MKLKRVMAVVLAAALTFSMAACGSKDAGTTPSTDNTQQGTTNTETPSTDAPEQQGTTNTETPTVRPNNNTSGTNDEIIIGTWWKQYYDSSATSLEADPSYTSNLDKEGQTDEQLHTNAVNRQIAQERFDNVKRIEEKYGVKFYWENLTFGGVTDSINTSILAGAPDCDLYWVNAVMGIPAQMNGLAIDLKTVLPADHDLFTDQKIMSYFDLGDGKACLIAKTAAEKVVEDTMPLGFNVQMLEDNNLEDPRVLWERGEWTWDKFIEYCQTLTQDTDGDGQIDQYGYIGYDNDTFQELLLSNGATIAQGATEGMSSPEVAEVLQLMYDMYNTYNVCYPYDSAEGASPWESMRKNYREGTTAFFPMACWINNDGNDYTVGYDNLQFDIAYCRWPVGPSGDKETNAGFNDIPNACLMIPAGVQEPEKVFNVIYDFWNFTGDVDKTIELRDDRAALDWWYVSTAKDPELQVANYNVMYECGSKTVTDLYGSLGISYDLVSIINGTMTPAQFQETYKQQVQDALDMYLGN